MSQKYARREGTKYGSYLDFPRKCKICNANPKRMIRHGYYESTTGKMHRKFKCKDCGHVMVRAIVSGPIGPAGVPGVNGSLN